MSQLNKLLLSPSEATYACACAVGHVFQLPSILTRKTAERLLRSTFCIKNRHSEMAIVIYVWLYKTMQTQLSDEITILLIDLLLPT